MSARKKGGYVALVLVLARADAASEDELDGSAIAVTVRVLVGGAHLAPSTSLQRRLSSTHPC